MLRSQTKASSHSRNILPCLTPGQYFFCFFSVFTLFLFLRNSESAIIYVSAGLRLCGATVIPALFPFLVVSELLVSSGTGEIIGKWIAKPFQKLFGISGVGFTVVFLGAVCGFPVGARSAISYYDQGLLSKQETERLLMFSNNPSSAFLISAVGISLFSSKKLGILLFCMTLLTAGIIGMVSKHFQKRSPIPIGSVSQSSPVKLHTGVHILTGAVSNAAGSMLQVCAYVVFFSALTGTFKLMLTTLRISEFLGALFTGVFEMTTGVGAAAALSDKGLAAILCAFLAGWSGFSVHMQILSITDGRNLSYRPYFLAKLTQGGLNAVCMWGCLKIFPDLLNVGNTAIWVPTAEITEYLLHPAAICCVLIFCIALLAKAVKVLRHCAKPIQ